jgi:hypothetical protein
LVAVVAKLKEWLWGQAALKTLAIGKAAVYSSANWERSVEAWSVSEPAMPLRPDRTQVLVEPGEAVADYLAARR